MNSRLRDQDSQNVSKLEGSLKKNSEESIFLLQELSGKVRSLEA